VKLSSSKGRIVATAGVILLVLFWLRPGASRLKARIAGSIGAALGRPVEISSVHIRLLPQPGFDLENLIVREAPAFGAEPMLRAPEVTAVVRLTSLVRGRIEIARLDLTEPSLNLVRGSDGRWNLENLLERTARSPLAPTAKSKSEPRPGFPYIQASSGRINFKIGQEKKPYALTDADFALWQESENTWGVRLKAQPLRTDLSLSDTGLLRMDGNWQRAGSLRETPVRLDLEWDRAQLGQLTKLASGDDKGWRGSVRLDVTLAGTPAALRVVGDASIQDFHRYDIASGEPRQLAAHCDARYSSVERMLHEVFCSAPVGSGSISLHGDAGLPASHEAALALDVERVPVSALAELARRAKKDLPDDLVATGIVQGIFAVREDGSSPRGAEFRGRGEIANLHLQSASNQAAIDVDSVPFALISQDTDRHHSSGRKSFRGLLKGGAGGVADPGEPRLEFGPVAFDLGTSVPTTAHGWIARSGYGVFVGGDAEVPRMLHLAHLLGLPALQAPAVGTVQINLQVAGSWGGWASGTPLGFSSPLVTGTARLRNIRAELRGVSGPIEIASAELQFAQDEVRVNRLNATAAGAHWSGSLDLARGCGTPGACVVRFNLNANEVGLSEIDQWLTAPAARHPWYQMLTTSMPTKPSFFENLRASGQISADRLRIRKLIATQVSASLELDRGKLKISDLRAGLLGGEYRGDWQADFSVTPPVYRGNGTVTAVTLEQIADAVHEDWITATASGTYQFTARGSEPTEFWQSAEGTLQFDLRDGVLPHILLGDDEGPLRIEHLQGRARFQDGRIEIKDAKLVSPGGNYALGGTASFGQELNLKLTRGADGKSAGAGRREYSITGTLAEPRVVQAVVPETQARLKQ